MMTTLCKYCNDANNSYFQKGKCYLCNNDLPELKELVEKAGEHLGKEECTSFSLSTTIPKDWLIREEKLWDEKTDCSRSIKDYLNNKLSKEVAKRYKKTYKIDGDCKLIFDLKSGNVLFERNQLFIFGRYEKLVNGISQSKWLCKTCQGKGCKKCDGKGKNYVSIEELIGEVAKKLSEAGEYTLHASGREDVDAFNSAGRPFVLCLKNPRKRIVDLKKLETGINKGKKIKVRDLKPTNRRAVELVSESHFDKEYIAEVEFEKGLQEKDVEKITSLTGVLLKQRTPTRVAHRRANLVRNRKIIDIQVLKSNKNTAIIKIMAEAGTYIKELISGDQGRTEPSISELLNNKAKCTKLTVSKIEDGFLDICKF